jgi:hypothetical protein
VDELERLVDEYHARASASARSRLDVLMSLERIRDPRVVPFLLLVLEDTDEVEQVRQYVLKQLRNGDGLLVPSDRAPVASAIGNVLEDASHADLRVQAAFALGEFTDTPGVLSRLGAVCLAQRESLDLRYTAFTSVQRAGPTTASLALLQQLTIDDTLGQSAQSLLAAWRRA